MKIYYSMLISMVFICTNNYGMSMHERYAREDAAGRGTYAETRAAQDTPHTFLGFHYATTRHSAVNYTFVSNPQNNANVSQLYMNNGSGQRTEIEKFYTPTALTLFHGLKVFKNSIIIAAGGYIMYKIANLIIVKKS